MDEHILSKGAGKGSGFLQLSSHQHDILLLARYISPQEKDDSYFKMDSPLRII